jgi:hypothetical protein
MAIRPTSINIDNSAGAADRVIRLQDIFTPSESNGVAAPVLTTVDRWRYNVLQGDSITLNELDLKGIKILGSLNVIADAIDPGCHVTVGYEFTKG